MSGSVAIDRLLTLKRTERIWTGQFDAMASPCQVLIAVDDRELAESLLRIAAHEAWRLEQKYSRYREDGIIPHINSSQGSPVVVDDETALLLNYAYQCYDLTEGRFDITSGILRTVWPFRPDSKVPGSEAIDALLPHIGLKKAEWIAPNFSLPTGMQIDLGGIGKEFAVDRSLQLMTEKEDIPMMVNYGGDIRCNRSPSGDKPWRVGVENSYNIIPLKAGALATSGSTHRYLIHNEKRYSHILNPLTGWPVEDAPLTVTVAADTCMQAGMLATFAMLNGADAEDFLEAQGVEYHAIR